MPILLGGGYRPLCAVCRDQGCPLCEGQRAELQAQRTRREVALDYARRRGLTQINEQLVEVLADAIAYGAQMARQELPAPVEAVGTDPRFQKLEYRTEEGEE